MIYRIIMDGNEILNDQVCNYALLNPVLNLEINTAGSFEFTMPSSHPYYNDVRPLISTIEIYEGESLLWFGRPVEIKADYWKQRLVYCEGALAFFNDSVQRPHEYENISLHTFFRTVIENHNAQVAVSRQFTVGAISVADSEVYRKLRYESTFDVLKRQCLNAEGGYLFVRREDGVNYIDWLSEMPFTCNQPVEFGLNLLDITSSFDGSSIATCLVPLGEPDEETGEELTVASVNGGSDTVESDAVSVYGRITKAVTFSGVKEASTLYADAIEYLQNEQFDNLVIECSAAELHTQNPNYESFRVGQMIHCRSVPHLVDRYFPLMKLSLRLDTAAKQITLGTEVRQPLTKIYKETQASEVAEAQEAMEGALDQITDRIDNLEEAIDDIPNELSALQDLQEDLSEIQDLGSSLSDRVGAAEERLGDMDSINNRLDNLQEQVNGISQGGGGGGDGWVHQIDGVTQAYGTINFVTG